MYGPPWIFWANLTPFSLEATILRGAAVGGVGFWTADALDYKNASSSGAMWRALLGQPDSPGG